MFVFPVTSLYQVFFHAIPGAFGAHSVAGALLMSVYSAVFTTLAVLSFTAGLKLALVKPDAVRFARRYLQTYLTANIVYFVFWMIIMRPTKVLSFAEMGWYHVVTPIGSFALWYFYLEHSKRVRETCS
jgi:uncharacterized membrane protein YgdD (TMEM256/DUF423 family)